MNLSNRRSLARCARTISLWKRLLPRGMNEWQDQDLRTAIWRKLLGTLDARGRLNWDEVFADGTLRRQKKGARNR